ncbi:MAG: DUF3343 domain-containing protein [Lachnospiraceae bacterium]|nr:DUF3343 domain-containing protein [Lachnospiraceae bacterium]
MREKKDYMVLAFHTTTEAMAFEKQAGISGIPGRLIPLPREISAGCGLAWRIPAGEYEEAEKQIQILDVKFQSITACRL